MGVYDPDALDVMRSIYRDVLRELSKSSRPLTRRLRDEIAQEVLHMVRTGTSDGAEIVASICERIDDRHSEAKHLLHHATPTKREP